MKDEIISSGDMGADFFAMLCEKSNGSISGVLELRELFPLQTIEKIYQFWVEITLPTELREKRMREKADSAAQEAADQLFNAKIKEASTNEEVDDGLQRFLDIYKRKT